MKEEYANMFTDWKYALAASEQRTEVSVRKAEDDMKKNIQLIEAKLSENLNIQGSVIGVLHR